MLPSYTDEPQPWQAVKNLTGILGIIIPLKKKSQRLPIRGSQILNIPRVTFSKILKEEILELL